ncbi:MAG: YggS family pyridoxal phosphate-dependent enzyme [Candidatus Omnitrophica bacterium]|nr:YggS family pyridoxal phosphate-dependent enzyme [Candidatus Omnitrophota bacterium]
MVSSNIKKVRAEIESARAASGRKASPIRLVLVTKTVDENRVREAYDAGEREFGENRVQELIQKKQQFPPDVRWHLVGHLQTNKVKEVVGQVVLIHSVDSVHLAKEIEKVSAKLNVVADVLIQVNTSGEASKFGLKPEELEDAVGEMTRFAHLKIHGLMTIGPLTDDVKKIRASFTLLRELQKKMKTHYPDLDWSELSMGMSDDYRIAIDEGATILRLGRIVFGERK